MVSHARCYTLYKPSGFAYIRNKKLLNQPIDCETNQFVTEDEQDLIIDRHTDIRLINNHYSVNSWQLFGSLMAINRIN